MVGTCGGLGLDFRIHSKSKEQVSTDCSTLVLRSPQNLSLDFYSIHGAHCSVHHSYPAGNNYETVRRTCRNNSCVLCSRRC